MKTIVLNNENVMTAHGFAVLNSGGDLRRFQTNPVMLNDHERGTAQVIGRWDNLRISGAELLADPVFDMADPVAAAVAGKYERGFLRAASMGICPLEYEILPVAGTPQNVVTKWELLEASIVDIPSNAAATVKLYNELGAVVSWKDVQLSMGDRNLWSFMEWFKNDPAGLERMKLTDPRRYDQLKKRGGKRPENLSGSASWTHLEWLKNAPETLAHIKATEPAKYQTILKTRK